MHQIPLFCKLLLNSCRYQPLVGQGIRNSENKYKNEKTLLSSNPIIILTLRKKQQAMNISASVLHGLDIGKKV
jgi:hypothetical protein